MEVSGQLQAPATLLTGRERQFWWAWEKVWTWWRKEKFLAKPGTESRVIQSVDQSKYAVSSSIVQTCGHFRFNSSVEHISKIKVKQSHYSPGQAHRIPGDWGFQISRQSAHESGKFVSPKHRPPLPPEIILGTHFCCRPGSSVGIATGYGLDGPEIESGWGCDFSHTSRPALGPTQPPVQWVQGLSRG
jgi:hypothetical protein